MLSRRDFLKLGGATLLAILFPRLETASADDTTIAPVIYHGSRRTPLVALTFDDCQLVTRLHMLEDVLKQNPDVRITLFPVGNALANVDSKDPGIWKRFLSNGHEFGYHSFYHDNLELYAPQQVVEDYDRWLKALTQVLGEQPTVRFGRPPYNIISYPFLFMCKERGLVCAEYSVGGGGPADFVMNAIKKSQNGDIIQFHAREQPDSQDITSASRAMPYFAGLEIQCVTLSRLYDDLLKEQNESDGCGISANNSLTRTCIE